MTSKKIEDMFNGTSGMKTWESDYGNVPGILVKPYGGFEHGVTFTDEEPAAAIDTLLHELAGLRTNVTKDVLRDILDVTIMQTYLRFLELELSQRRDQEVLDLGTHTTPDQTLEILPYRNGAALLEAYREQRFGSTTGLEGKEYGDVLQAIWEDPRR